MNWSRSLVRVGSVIVLVGLSNACSPSSPSTPRAQTVADGRARDARDLIEQARRLADLGDYVRAEQYAERASQAGARPSDVVPLLLEVCIRDQRYRAAVEHGQRHLKRNPNDHATRLLIATLHIALGEADLARRELETVIAHRPDLAQAHYVLAVLLRDELGNYAGADDHFREYLRLDPNGSHAGEASGSLLSRLP